MRDKRADCDRRPKERVASVYPDARDSHPAPVRSPPLKTAVAAPVELNLLRDENAPVSLPLASLVLDPDLALFPILRDVGLALEATVQRHGKAIEIASLSGSSLGPWRRVNSAYDECGHYSNAVGLNSAAIDVVDPDLANGSLRIRGTDAGALAFWQRDVRWSGEIVMPLATAIEQEQARQAKR